MRKIASLILFLLTLGACSSTHIILSDKWNRQSKPSYVDYVNGYWWGLDGTSEISIQKACVDQKPHAVQKVMTPEDGVIRLFTLGIYSPTTIKIWCGE